MGQAGLWRDVREGWKWIALVVINLKDVLARKIHSETMKNFGEFYIRIGKFDPQFITRRLSYDQVR